MFKKPYGYCEIFDSTYNRFGKWLESKCTGKKCDYCINRPKKHSKSCRC